MNTFDLARTILRQYSASENLNSIIYKFNDAIGIDQYINDFYDLIWNIETADTYGLDIWGKIVVVSRLLTTDRVESCFGFNEALSPIEQEGDPLPFDEGVFYDGGVLTETVRLSNDVYRRLIMVKAMTNITDCSIPELNQQLLYLFSDKGKPFVADTQDMSMKYVFPFDLSAGDLAIVTKSGVIPRPTGVQVHVLNYDFDHTFGFNEGDWEPFDHGVFFIEEQLIDV